MIVNGTPVMTFTREPAAAWESARVDTDAAPEALHGLWNCDRIVFGDVVAGPEDVGVGLTAEISGKHVILATHPMGDNTAGMDFTCEADGEFADGVLTITAPVLDIKGGTTVYAIALLEDGTMAITCDMYGDIFTFYMSAVE